MILKDKKIAVLHPQIFEVGGAVNMMIYLSSFLFERGSSVVFFTTKFKRENFLREINFPIEVVNFSFKIISYFIIAYRIRKYEVVIIGNSPMHFVGVLSKILFKSKAKLLWWNHHYPWYYDKKHSTIFIKIKRILEKLLVRHIDVLIANGKYIKNSLEEIFPENKQVKVLYPRVKDIFYNICKPKDIQKSKISILTYSRWVGGKNIKLIFDAFEKLRETCDFNLFIGGEGSELEYFKKKYSNHKNIAFLGFLDDNSIIKYSKQSDIFLFPSKVDSFGMVMLEAMFCGLPVVGFNSGGASGLINDGENGFLVESDKDFIKKTQTLLIDTNLRKSFSEKSLSIARSDFDKNIFKKQLEEILS